MKVAELMEWLAEQEAEAELVIEFLGEVGPATRLFRELDAETSGGDAPAISIDVTGMASELFAECLCREVAYEYETSSRADALAGIDIDHYWWHRPGYDLTTSEWCAVWRSADRRPELTGPIRLYRGGGGANSMSWTSDPGVALAFANHHYGTTWEYREIVGPLRLPLWSCTFPPEAVLAVLDVEREFVIDIERFPPRGAERYEPTAEDLVSYREFAAPLLPTA